MTDGMYLMMRSAGLQEPVAFLASDMAPSLRFNEAVYVVFVQSADERRCRSDKCNASMVIKTMYIQIYINH